MGKNFRNLENMIFRLILVIKLVFSFVSSKAQSNLERGITFYENRAEKHHDLKVDSTNINTAILFFHNELKTANDQKATEYLLQCYYFKGAFVVRTKEEQQKNYLKGTLLGKHAIKIYPKNEAILMWYIANFSKYGESLGVINSIKNGLADKVKFYTEKLIVLNPKFNDGVGYKILGVINYKVPLIPLVLTWPSKIKAEDYLKKALGVNPKSISNLYYYAEFLNEVKRNEEAKIILIMVIDTPPRKTDLIEDMYDINQAIKLLEKLKKQ